MSCFGESELNTVKFIGDSGLTLSSVMPFAVSTLQHPSGPVRETGERIIVGLYREKGREVRRYLPSSDTSARKNMIYRQLFDTFERIDEENQVMADKGWHGRWSIKVKDIFFMTFYFDVIYCRGDVCLSLAPYPTMKMAHWRADEVLSQCFPLQNLKTA